MLGQRFAHRRALQGHGEGTPSLGPRLVELFTLDPERHRSSATVRVRTFLQASMEPPEEKRHRTGLRCYLQELQQIPARLRHEVNPVKMVAEEDVAEVSHSVSRLVERVEACLVKKDMSALFHSQGVLRCTGARVWRMLGVSVDGFEETCGAAVARPEAVLVMLSSAPAQWARHLDRRGPTRDHSRLGGGVPPPHDVEGS